MAGRVEDRSILVTGAGSGMGRAVAVRLAAEGAKITIFDLGTEGAEETRAQIEAAGGTAIVTTGDVTNRADVTAAVAAAAAEFGRLDVLFAIAGVITPMRFLETTEENWRRTLDINGLGSLICQQEAAKQMIAQGGGGKLVLTSSIAGRQGYADMASYCASKFAVGALVQAGARGLAEHGITVNSFAPGVVDTPLWKRLDLELMDMGESERPGDAFVAFSSTALRGRPATADDVLGTALFLASTDSDYMTGQNIMIDGGMVLV